MRSYSANARWEGATFAARGVSVGGVWGCTIQGGRAFFGKMVNELAELAGAPQSELDIRFR